MGYDYHYGNYGSYGGYDEVAAALLGVLLVWGAVLLFALVIGVAIWVFRAWSLDQIATRRGLSHSWLSWLPVGRDWIIGSVSDQYQYLVCGRIRSRRKLLLGFSVGSFAGGVLLLLAVLWVFAEAAMAAAFHGDVSITLTGAVLLLPLLSVLTLASGIVAFVLRCICMYDLYRSCDPGCAVVFLVLGILFNVCEPFFLWACRKKDLGMPPRRPSDAEYSDRYGDPTYL